MTTKNYNALAAEMMGWCLYDTERWEPVPEELQEYALDNDGYHWEGSELNYAHNWNPLENRNQAYELLKRAEALGLVDEVEYQVYQRLKYFKGFDFQGQSIKKNNWAFLTCPTDIITMACVDVWEGTKEDA